MAFKKKFNKVYKIKDFKEISDYFNIKIKRTGVGTIEIMQKKYTMSILKRFKIINYKPTQTSI